MTIRECYERSGSSFAEVERRLGSEIMVQRFAVRFLNDTSFPDLQAAVSGDDWEAAFRAAHTLKGVCLTLGFDRLYEASADLTEQIRSRNMDVIEARFSWVSEEYRKLTDLLREVK